MRQLKETNLRLIVEIEAFSVVVSSPQKSRRQLKNVEKLGVAKRRRDFAMLRQALVGVGFANLVHLAGELTQQLYTDHTVVGRSL